MENAFINWSGGKDCTLALHHVLAEGKFKVSS
ncbi:MAG: ATP-binding protein, partial [Bacteroidia bacterium]|nr:ATP-binding protein [Bacteroidia bacterium]